MQFQLIRGQFEGQFIRNSGATLDDGAAAGSVTLAAAASPRAGTQGIRRCAGCRRGRLQATAAGPPRAANLTSATGEFDLGARALVTTLVPSAHVATLWPRSAPRAPRRSWTTAVGTQSHLAACAGSNRLAHGITGLACYCRRLPAPPPPLLLQTATDSLLSAANAGQMPVATTDLCAPPSPQAHGRHQSGVQRCPGH